MQAHEFTSKWIDLAEDSGDDDLSNSSALVMVKDKETKKMYEVLEFDYETNDDGSVTVWITVEEF